jgi:hypothetical protein
MIESIHRVLALSDVAPAEVPVAGVGVLVGAAVVDVGADELVGVVAATGTAETGACVLGADAVGCDLGGV